MFRTTGKREAAAGGEKEILLTFEIALAELGNDTLKISMVLTAFIYLKHKNCRKRAESSSLF